LQYQTIMAEIKLNLRQPTAEKETPINIIVRFNNQKLVYSSGKKIHPRFWETARQKAKKTKEFTSAELLNSCLQLITQIINDEIEKYLKLNDQHFPSPSELKRALDIGFGRASVPRKMNFFEFINWFTYEYAPKKQIVTNAETSVTSINTLKTYKTTLRLLETFARVQGSFDFKDINMNWYYRFTL
jgi:hypothetical protein